jgi:uncharacterized membrane protein YvlD (DUF360 family)
MCPRLPGNCYSRAIVKVMLRPKGSILELALTMAILGLFTTIGDLFILY